MTIGLITVILDGVGAKQLANQWAVAPESEKPVALALVSANETINFAIAGLFNMSFAGVPFILFGLAVALGRHLPALAGLDRRGCRSWVDRRRSGPGFHRRTDDGVPHPDDHRSNRDLAVAAGDGDPAASKAARPAQPAKDVPVSDTRRI